MKTKSLQLDLGRSSYHILIGKGVIKDLTQHLPPHTSSIFVLSDKGLVPLRKKLMNILKTSGLPVHEIALTAGEILKSIKAVYPVYGKLLELKADRNSVIIALGGGSIGDAAGFIAATYLRGISWIGVPTTLLAQVDSSVGGKTGINHESGKNLIGAFHQPSLVVCDTDMLNSLGKREIVSGIGEIVKYALTFDKDFFFWLEKNIDNLLKKSPKHLIHAIEKSFEWKCRVVSQDEFDREGIREVLNFGHTFGHALESVTNYKKFQHGEAVIWGMRFALALSEQRERIESKKAQRADNLLAALPVPPLPKPLDQKKVFGYMKKDKKAQGDIVRFVLLKNIGKSVSDKKVEQKDLEITFEKLTAQKKRKAK